MPADGETWKLQQQQLHSTLQQCKLFGDVLSSWFFVSPVSKVAIDSALFLDVNVAGL